MTSRSRRTFASVCLALGATLPTVFPAMAQNVGVSAAVNQSARGLRPGASVRTIVIGDNVVYNERIETNTAGLLQILLADGTTFTVGPNSSLSIDRFVYDPAAGTAEVTASLTKGVFRFIGGKTSKTPGGVQLNTPVGTIGIRGAMADLKINGTVSEFALKFGRSLTLTDRNGDTERVHEPGYSLVVTTNADGTQRREIRRTPPAFTNEIQQTIAGAPGTSGGVQNPRTGEILAQTQIAKENSDRPPEFNAPLPTPRPSDVGPFQQENRDIAQESSDDVSRPIVIAEAAEIVTNPSTGEPSTPPSNVPTTPPVGEPTVPPTDTPTPVKLPYPVQLITAGSTYVQNNGTTVSNPGAVGLVGGSVEEDRSAAIETVSGSGRASGATNRGELVLPLVADGDFAVTSIPLDGQASLGGVPLSGLLYSGVDNFRAYALSLDGDPTRPVYAIAGNPISDTSVFQNSDVRTYAFYPDLLQGIAVPFTRAGALGTDYDNASISDLYILEGDAGGRLPVTYQTWLMIDGNGPGQRSGVGVNVGRIDADADGNATFIGNRRGTFRSETIGFSSATGGTVASATGPNGGNAFFGPNGQYFILAGDASSNDFFSDSNAYRSPSEQFSTAHVLALTSETNQADFLAGRGTDRALAATSSRTIAGYAAGLIEVGRPDGSYVQVLGTSAAIANPFSIEFRGDENTLGGTIAIGDEERTNAINTPFGNGVGGNTNNGNSAYIDDDLFAAVNNNSRSRNTVTTYETDPNTSAVTTTTYRQLADVNPRTYLVSGDANPQPNLMPNGKLCDCDFLEWGWWGTQLTASEPSAGTPNIRAGVHLGTWVAGDISTDAQLAPMTGSATFSGGVVGNVSAAAPGGGIDDYVAAGAMSMSYDFGQRSGSMSITNFDNRDFQGAISAGMSPANPSGFLQQQAGGSNGAQGSFNGTFVNDGATIAKGVIGNFDLATPGGDWAAAGVVAGARP